MLFFRTALDSRLKTSLNDSFLLDRVLSLEGQMPPTCQGRVVSLGTEGRVPEADPWGLG